ncbi:MAG: hypothetical protein ACUVS4_17520 [Chloroflexaceae bacterium]
MFLQSLDHHILRNAIVLYAIEQGLPIPLGSQTADLLGADSDLDAESDAVQPGLEEEGAVPGAMTTAPIAAGPDPYSIEAYRRRAAALYAQYAGPLKNCFNWISPGLFKSKLKTDLLADVMALIAILQRHGGWNPVHDVKLAGLIKLLRGLEGKKVLIFTQFADTVDYLVRQLRAAGIARVEGVTG